MGSDSNKITSGTSYHPTEPAPCANGCGFFGAAATNGFCSKCFRDVRIKEEQAASAKAAVNKLVNKVMTSIHASSSSSTGSEPVQSPVDSLPVELKNKRSNRCLMCNKKVGVVGFKCRCGEMFCGSHRYPEEHDCEFDFKRTGRDAIARDNPVVRADKVDRI